MWVWQIEVLFYHAPVLGITDLTLAPEKRFDFEMLLMEIHLFCKPIKVKTRVSSHPKFSVFKKDVSVQLATVEA